MKSIFPVLLSLSLVLLFILQACETQHLTISEHEFGDCLVLDFPDKQFASLCQDSSRVDTSQYCDKTIIEEVFELDGEDKFWLPAYCCEVGEGIHYVDETKQSFSLFIIEKHYDIIQSSFLGDEHSCPEQTHKKPFYCVSMESAKIQLRTVPNNAHITFTNVPNRSDFYIHLSVALAQDKSNINQFLKGTSIALTEIGDRSKGDTINHIQGIIDQGTLPEQNDSNAEFHTSIDLADRTFSNVHAFTNEVDGSIQKIYYNMDLGLVGFVDETGKTWRLSDQSE